MLVGPLQALARPAPLPPSQSPPRLPWASSPARWVPRPPWVSLGPPGPGPGRKCSKSILGKRFLNLRPALLAGPLQALTWLRSDGLGNFLLFLSAGSRQWEAGRAKVRELKRTVSFHFVYALIGRLWELQGRLGSCLRDPFDTNHFLGVSSRGFVMSTVESGLADRDCCVQGRGLYGMGCVDGGEGRGRRGGAGILPCVSRACVRSSPDVQ